ncbi:MAG: hypothetical protein COB67_03955 [SAR324 cluster bacterium]|uniref:histidine kinase n=1 Tax=SAR324 cluster bacterium TaxID=2024889 RepID=A0A2A4T897_9DELT|nr:MAG: hypothetical protein COB67_03955 [SAR324 cluster bacterium]
MKIHLQAILLVSLTLISLSGFFLYRGITQHKENIDHILQLEEQNFDELAKQIQHNSFDSYQATLNDFVHFNQSLIPALVTQNQQLLRQSTIPFFKHEQSKNPDFLQLRFFLADGTSFLSMNPDYSLTIPQKALHVALEERKKLAGFQWIQGEVYYQIVQPIFSPDGKKLGTVALYLGIERELQLFELELHSPAAIYIVASQADKDLTLSGNIKKFGDFIIMTEQFPIFQKLPSDLNLMKHRQRVHIDDKWYVLHQPPMLKNFLGEHIGGIILLNDITQEVKKVKQYVLSSLLFTGGILTVTLLVLHFSFRWLLRRLENSKQKLQNTVELLGEEIQEKKEAQLLLKQAHDKLDQRVKERTQELGQANLQLKSSNKKLKSLDKLKDDFLAMVTHELRTPMVSILGYADTLQECKLSWEEQKKFTEIIIDEGERLSALIDNILDMSSLDSGQLDFTFKDVELDEIINTAVRAVEGSLIKTGNLKIEAPQTNIHFVGDFGRITQVIINLLGNAIKFSPEVGRITLSVESKSDFFTLKISDQGPGIPEDQLQQIFQKFQQVKAKDRKVKGTGLGLTISQGIIEAHQGQIWAENREEGALFCFTLPLQLAG